MPHEMAFEFNLIPELKFGVAEESEVQCFRKFSSLAPLSASTYMPTVPVTALATALRAPLVAALTHALTTSRIDLTVTLTTVY